MGRPGPSTSHRMLAPLLALLALAPFTAATANICAGVGNVRVRTPSGGFQPCLNGQPWGTAQSCPASPPGLRFSFKTQTCVPTTHPLVPAGPFDSPPAAPVAPSIFLYVWSGVDNPGPKCKDSVVVIDGDVNSTTFGRVVDVEPTPFWGTEPHHCTLQATSANLLYAGSIQGYLSGAPDAHIFNTTIASQPAYLRSVDPPQSAVTDSFIVGADGAAWVSQMGSATGGSPGRIARIGSDFSVLGEFPATPDPDFNPHGFAINGAGTKMVTADNFEMKSSLFSKKVPLQFRGSGKTIYRHKLRVWELPGFTPAAGGVFETDPTASKGFMTVAFVPSTPIAVSGNGLGVLYGINVSAPNPAATAKPVHYISGSGTGSCVFAQLAFTGGTRFVVTVLGLSVVQLVDTSDPWNWRLIQEIYLPQGTYPHAVTAARSGRLLAVSTYYINHEYNGEVIGAIRDEGSKEVFFIDVAADGNSFAFNKRVPVVDFKKEPALWTRNAACGDWRPHGMQFKAAATPPPLGPQPVIGVKYSIRVNRREVESGELPAFGVPPTALTGYSATEWGSLFSWASGTAQFQLRASGTAHVYIGGRAVSALSITRGSAASPPTRTARVNVRAGETTVVIDYWPPSSGAAALQLLWKGPSGTEWEALPVAPTAPKPW